MPNNPHEIDSSRYHDEPRVREKVKSFHLIAIHGTVDLSTHIRYLPTPKAYQSEIDYLSVYIQSPSIIAAPGEFSNVNYAQISIFTMGW